MNCRRPAAPNTRAPLQALSPPPLGRTRHSAHRMQAVMNGIAEQRDDRSAVQSWRMRRKALQLAAEGSA